MNANGTDTRRLTDHLAFDFWPAWAPDGTRLAFTSDRDSLAYSIGKSGLAVFVQGDAFSYSVSEMTSPNFGRFSRIQIDLGWSAGASYRLPL